MTFVKKTPTGKKLYEYDRMSPEQFSAALDDLNLPPLEFARLSGFDPRRVDRMLSGEEEIPHQVLIMCCLMALDDEVNGLGLTRDVTDLVIHTSVTKAKREAWFRTQDYTDKELGPRRRHVRHRILRTIMGTNEEG